MEEFKENFLNVVKNNYINFSGRARRQEFWQYLAVYIIINAAIGILFGILAMVASFFVTISMAISGLLGLALLLPSLGLTVRRLHDVNKTGWFILVNIIPLVGQIYFIYLLIQEGDKGANQYGEDPKA